MSRMTQPDVPPANDLVDRPEDVGTRLSKEDYLAATHHAMDNVAHAFQTQHNQNDNLGRDPDDNNKKTRDHKIEEAGKHAEKEYPAQLRKVLQEEDRKLDAQISFNLWLQGEETESANTPSSTNESPPPGITTATANYPIPGINAQEAKNPFSQQSFPAHSNNTAPSYPLTLGNASTHPNSLTSYDAYVMSKDFEPQQHLSSPQKTTIHTHNAAIPADPTSVPQNPAPPHRTSSTQKSPPPPQPR